MEAPDIIWAVKKDATKRLVESGKRPDERQLDERRQIEFTPNYIPRAEGSCLIRLGNTLVLVGVKMAVAEPYPDSPDRGVLMTGAELIPLASPNFTSGPPDETAIEVARVVDRGIRESEMIEFEKLCMEPGEKVWNVLVDIHVLDHDGNLIDAASYAAVKALMNTQIPKYEDERIIYDEKIGALPLREKPVSNTFAKIGNSIVLDPTFEEEMALDSRLTIVTTQEDQICAMQKGGSGPVTEAEFDRLIDVAIEKSKDVRKQF